MYSANSTIDLMAALVEAEKLVGPNPKWENGHELIDNMLKMYDELRPHLQALSDAGTIEATSDWMAAIVNYWFADRGFDIKLVQDGVNKIYLGSIQNQFIKWKYIGTDTSWKTPLVTVKDGIYMEHVTSYSCEYYTAGDVYSMPTVNGDTVYMAILDEGMGTYLSKQNVGFMEMVKRIEHILKPKRDVHLYLPMIDFSQGLVVHWMKSINLPQESGEIIRIMGAGQQLNLKINNEGAEVMEEKTPPLIPLKIYTHYLDRPFLLWINRPGIPFPILSAWVTQKHWKRPVVPVK